METRPRRTWLWVSLGLLVVVALALIYRFHTQAAAKDATGANGASGGTGAAGNKAGRGQNGPAAITVGKAQTGDINIYVDALGTVTPAATVTVYSQITGRVMAVYYREGQVVRKGQALVEIDPRPSQAALQQAKGQLKHDQGVLAQAKIDFARYQAAFARDAIAKQQVDDQEQAVAQSEGTVQADQGTVQADEVQLSYCHIVAPISGRVGLRLVDPGNTVFSGSSSTLVVITQLQPITVVFNVSEDQLPAVQAQLKAIGPRGSLAVAAFDRADEKQLEAGKLTSLDNEIDTTTGTVKFRASFANQDLALFPNQFVNARLLVNTLHNATLVPTAAVQHNGTAAFVYLVNPDNTVKLQAITTATSNEKVTAVSGLQAGATLATSGFDRLESGVHVAVKGERAGASGAQGPGAATGASGATGSGSASGHGTP